MATELAPQPVGNQPDGKDAAVTAPTARTARTARTAAPDEPEVVDVTGLELRPAPESDEVAGLLEVDVPAPTQPGARPLAARTVAMGVAAVLAVVVAPLLVLLGALVLPMTEQAQGAVLVLGWTALAAGAHWIDTRRDRRPRPAAGRRAAGHEDARR